MANYTVSGSATYPDNVTPLRGEWTIRIYTDSGVTFDLDGSWRGGQTTLDTDKNGALSVTLPQTDGTYLYEATFRSRDRKVTLGPYLFDLTANKTWQSVITAPTMLPVSSRLPAYTTGTRPSAATLGAGAPIYDTTLGKPIWSNGTNWRDATGTAV